MSEYIFDKAKRLKDQGLDYGKIRTYLQNGGYSHDEVTSVFYQLDEINIHQEYRKQKISSLRSQFVVAIIFSSIGLGFALFQIVYQDRLGWVSTLLSLSLLGGSYLRLKEARRRTYTTAQILKENRSAGR